MSPTCSGRRRASRRCPRAPWRKRAGTSLIFMIVFQTPSRACARVLVAKLAPVRLFPSILGEPDQGSRAPYFARINGSAPGSIGAGVGVSSSGADLRVRLVLRDEESAVDDAAVILFRRVCGPWQRLPTPALARHHAQIAMETVARVGPNTVPKRNLIGAVIKNLDVKL